MPNLYPCVIVKVPGREMTSACSRHTEAQGATYFDGLVGCSLAESQHIEEGKCVREIAAQHMQVLVEMSGGWCLDQLGFSQQ